MKNKLLLFSFLTSIAFSDYYSVDTDKTHLKIHEDIAVEHINTKDVDEIYTKLATYFGIDVSKAKTIYITPYNIKNPDPKVSSSNMKPDGRKLGRSLVVRLANDYMMEYDTLDAQSFDYIFTLHLAESLFLEKVKQSLPVSMSYMDYLFSVRNMVSDIMMPDWLGRGVAVFLANKFSPKSVNNIRLSKLYTKNALGAIDYSYIQGHDVRHHVTPSNVLSYLKTDDFYLKYVFADFLEYFGKQHGDDSVKTAIVKLASEVKDKKPLARDPFKVFADMTKQTRKELGEKWWSQIEKGAEVSYKTLTSMSVASDLKFMNGKPYFLTTTKDGRSIQTTNKDGKFVDAVSGKDIECFDVHKGDIYFTAKELVSEEDKYRYNLYKNRKLIRTDCAPRFVIRPSIGPAKDPYAVLWIKDHGLVSSMWLEKEDGTTEMLVDTSKGLKIKSLCVEKATVHFEGAIESEGSKIYTVSLFGNGIDEEFKGKHPISTTRSTYYLSDHKGVTSLFEYNQNTDKTYLRYKGNEVSSFAISNNKLYVLENGLKGSKLVEVKDKPLFIKGSALSSKKYEESIAANFKGQATKLTWIKAKPIIDLFGVEAGLGFDVFRGSLASEKTASIQAVVPFLELFKDKVFNPQVKYEIRAPIYLKSSRTTLVWFFKGAFAYVGGDDNFMSTGAALEGDNGKLIITQKMGITKISRGRVGTSFVLDHKNVFAQYYTGSMSEEVYVPSTNLRIYDLVKATKDVFKSSKIDATHFFICGLKTSMEKEVNLTPIPYKFKIGSIAFKPGIYYTHDLKREDHRVFIVPNFVIKTHVYNMEVDIRLTPALAIDTKRFAKEGIGYLGKSFKFDFGLDWIF